MYSQLSVVLPLYGPARRHSIIQYNCSGYPELRALRENLKQALITRGRSYKNLSRDKSKNVLKWGNFEWNTIINLYMTCIRVESWLRRFPTPQRGAHALDRHDNATHLISFAKIRHNMCRKETTTQPSTTTVRVVCTVLSCDVRISQDSFWNTYSHVREHCGPPYRTPFLWRSLAW